MRASVAALRRYVVAHQGYAARFRRAGAGAVGTEVRRLQAVQLDSIATVDRAHRLTLVSRIGAYDEAEVSRLLSEGRIFEYWAHEACLLAIEDYPLFKRRMLELRDRHWWGRERTAEGRAVEQRVLARIREEGALPVRAFEGRSGPMWSWKPEKRALEHLFAAGEVAIAGRQGFQRVYDLPERVIPERFLGAPVPSEAAFRRGYALRAVEGRGALTEAGIAEHCRFAGGGRAVRPHVDALVAEGRLRRLEVEDGGPPVLVPAAAELDGAPAAPVLLSPFDNLMWDRAFLRRLFGFDHLIEVYKRAHERVYGYYVLPLLLGERFVGRADVKADRARGVLQVKRFTPEPGVRRRLDEPLERAATRLARALGLEAVER
ncbi:MAG TPA: crosslink repair DNA glycosylase YcaQ family protein [Gaiellaceae bacterium]|nr:crosslink repair DNA glycosylase YcaQ family protein [Gaiellaceae bacterium]